MTTSTRAAGCWNCSCSRAAAARGTASAIRRRAAPSSISSMRRSSRSSAGSITRIAIRRTSAPQRGRALRRALRVARERSGCSSSAKSLGSSSNRNQLDPLKVGTARGSADREPAALLGELRPRPEPHRARRAGITSSLRSSAVWDSSPISRRSPTPAGSSSAPALHSTGVAESSGFPAGTWQVRGDITNELYTIAYPEAFFVAPAGGTAVVSADAVEVVLD